MNSLFFEEFTGPIFRENIFFTARKLNCHISTQFSVWGKCFLFLGQDFFGLVYLQFGQFFTNMSTINSRSFLGMITNNVTHIQYFFNKRNFISEFWRNLAQNF